jgi:hypothetical protein
VEDEEVGEDRRKLPYTEVVFEQDVPGTDVTQPRYCQRRRDDALAT